MTNHYTHITFMKRSKDTTQVSDGKCLLGSTNADGNCT